MASRFTSRLLATSRPFSSNRGSFSCDISHHPSAFHVPSELLLARAGSHSDVSYSCRRYGDDSKCRSSQPASTLRPIGRAVENPHGTSSSFPGPSLTPESLLPHEIKEPSSSSSTSLLPSLFASTMAQRASASQPALERGYHQLAPLQGANSDAKDDVKAVALSAIEAVAPNEMIVKAIQVENGMLVVQDKSYPLRRNVYVAAFGKAVLGMIRAVEELLGDHIVRGVASVPHGIRETLIKNDLHHHIPGKDSKIEIYEGAKYNLPDEDCVEATKRICALAESLSHGDILLVLISGGGSALLTLPQSPITLEDVLFATKALSAEGATITQLNMMRRHLSMVKGGRFAQIAAPAQVVSLILSDVLGDPLEAIASGPTVPCLTTAQCCLDVMASFKLQEKHEDSKGSISKIVNFLETKKERDQEAEKRSLQTLGLRFRNVYEEKMGNFSHVQNLIVGTNKMVVEEALSRAETLGYRSLLVSTMLDGIARERGVDLANMALYACSLMRRHGANEPNKKLARLELDLVAKGLSKELSVHLSRVAASASNSGGGMCFVAAGETTVQLAGEGKGGRNQELALAAGLALHELSHGNVVLANFDVMILSIGTDGQDGPTDAAGAFIDSNFIRNSGFTAEQAREFLDNNDSYNFFKQAAGGAYQIMTGLTGTNVMDLQLILIKPKGSPLASVSHERTRNEFNQTYE